MNDERMRATTLDEHAGDHCGLSPVLRVSETPDERTKGLDEPEAALLPTHTEQNEKEIKTTENDDRPLDFLQRDSSRRDADLGRTQHDPAATDRQSPGVDMGNVAGGNGAGVRVDSEHSVDALLSTQRSSARLSQPMASAALAGKLSAQFSAVQYKHSEWKRSRVKKGKLIKRLTGYSIAETEYGVSYLWVLSRKPDRTSADNSVYGNAGYYNWKALEDSGLLRKEKKTK